LSLLLVGWAEPRMAAVWDNFGQMMLAAVAWQHLAPTPRAQASKLLRLNPDYAIWISHEPPDQQDVIALLRASTWPHTIKHKAGYIDDGEHTQRPDANPNIGNEELREHRNWHDVDVMQRPFGPVPAPTL
jgi:hypothetical protein